MRFVICLFCFFIFNVANAEDNNAPVSEPNANDINARLDKVEQSLNNRGLLDMLELLESLKVEMSTLRGQIEVQTHTIEQLKQRQRDLYTDVDKRIQRIEQNKSKNQNAETVPESTAKPEESTPTEENDVEPVDPTKAEAVYQKAFKLLKESQYGQAHVAFKAFLKDYPDSAFSDNAQYWLGETNYVRQEYELAINEYQALLNTFPDSKKVSHALLKIGYSYAELGNADDAKKTLKEVMAQYPGTTAARLADERLKKIRSTKESNT